MPVCCEYKDPNMPITTCVFDAYGTLFDVAAAARLAAQEGHDTALADQWQKLAEIWRDKQLQYTWLRTITQEHCDFWQVTQDGLDFALEALSLDKNDARRERLVSLGATLGTRARNSAATTPKCFIQNARAASATSRERDATRLRAFASRVSVRALI